MEQTFTVLKDYPGSPFKVGEVIHQPAQRQIDLALAFPHLFRLSDGPRVMELTNEFEPIRLWAHQKGILTKGDAKTQTVKLMEEVGELAHAILKDKQHEVEDAIGDIAVVLTSIASHRKVTIEKCINGSYDVIAKRTGTMINGNFVKDN